MRTLYAALSTFVFGSFIAPYCLAEDYPVRVDGYFCGSDKDQIAFLTRKAEGDNDIKAANIVNKRVGRQSCADYGAVYIVHQAEEVVVANGRLFKIHKVMLLPENMDLWTGSLVSSLDVENRRRGT